MAKPGEGDERWIVKERRDGKNVGNWHWTERNVLPIARDKFLELCHNLEIPNTFADVKILCLDLISGDLNICNRKGKTFFIFDFSLKFKWDAFMKKNDDTVIHGNGTIEIDVEMDGDKKFRIIMENENKSSSIFKEILDRDAKPMLYKVIQDVLDYLTEEKNRMQEEINILKQQQVTVPETGNQNEQQQEQVSTPPPPQGRIQNFNSQITVSNTETLSTTTIRQVVEFESANPQEIYETLTDPRRISAFTGAFCNLQTVPGSEFVLLDGAVTGTIKEVTPNKKISQKWRFKDWPENHFSDLTITLSSITGGTKLSLIQKNVPSSDSNRTIDGWENVFWRRIYTLFGWHYTMKRSS